MAKRKAEKKRGALLIRRANQLVDETFLILARKHPLLDEFEVTARQLAVILVVAAERGLSQTRICELTGIDRSTLADIVRRLVKRGILARRRTKEDARMYAVGLTDIGESILKAGVQAADAVEEKILAALGSETARDSFISQLDKVNAALAASGKSA